ncbi:MAG: hypothetical protein ACHQT8_00340 [Chlamydiales bacterium]
MFDISQVDMEPSYMREDSWTRKWVADLTEWRNGPIDCGAVGRRATAGLTGYPLLFVAALVEAVVRLVFGVLLLPLVFVAAIACCNWELEDPCKRIGHLFSTVLDQFDAALRCMVGFVKNFYSANISFEQLHVCAECVRTENMRRSVNADLNALGRGRSIIV